MNNAGRSPWRGRTTVAVVIALLAVGGWLVTSRDSASPVRATSDGKIIEEFAPDERVSVPQFGGDLLDGTTFDSAEVLGRVAVYNLWGSWCGPCRTEAPALARFARERRNDVEVVGINMRDNDGAARAFERAFDVPYESITTDDSGTALMAFGPALSSAAIPSTVVVDQQGRIAARVVGPVTYGTLSAIVDSVLAESPSVSR